MNLRNRTTRAIVVGVFAGLAVALPNAAPAHAQIDNGLPGPQPIDMSSVILSGTMNKMRLDAATGVDSSPKKHKISAGTIAFLRRWHPDSPDLPENAGKRVSAANPAVTTYRADPQVSQKTTEKFLQWAATTDPQAAQTLRQTFAQYPPVQVWSGLVRSYGLQPGDLADAFAAYWSLNYAVAHGQGSSEPSQVRGLRDQIKALFARTSAIQQATSAQKQAMAETWMLEYMVQRGAFSSATKRGDQTQLQRLQTASVTRFQHDLHLNPLQIALTRDGFSHKSQ